MPTYDQIIKSDILVKKSKHNKSGNKCVKVTLLNKESESGEYNIKFEGDNCPKCKDGVFRVKFNVVNKGGGKKELVGFRHEMKTKHNRVIKGEFLGKKIVRELSQQDYPSRPSGPVG